MSYLTNKEARTMILSPLSQLLKSRRFWLLVINALVLVLVTEFPQLSPLAPIILEPTFQISVLVLIVGLSVEDAVATYNETKASLPDNLSDNIRQIVDTVINGDDSNVQG